MDLAGALRRVTGGGTLERAEAAAVFSASIGPDTDPAALGGLLAALATRGETVHEIAGAVDALREAAIEFEHPFADRAIDTCGTGGDGIGSFNLSTASAIVAAAAGAKVVKHGNRALSSKCGSADLLEAAGVKLELSPQGARAVLEEVGITFLFAPLYHPALRFAGPVRRALGVRTIFNLLGPLLNPGATRRQMVGVGEAARAEAIAQVLRELGHARAYVVHGAGGADELTLAGANVAIPVGDAPPIAFDAVSLGLRPAGVEALAGGDAARNLQLLGAVLEGGAGPLVDAVLLNAACALVVAGVADDGPGGVARAREAIQSGAARATLAGWIEATRGAE